MKKILWISRRVPYDGVAHAGGQIHNYLLKKFHEKSNCFLISFAKENECAMMDLDRYGISSYISVISSKKNIAFLGKKFFSLLFFFTIFLGFDSFWYMWRTFRGALEYRRRYGSPDVVVLQWTEMVNQIVWLKRLFPNSKFVSIEEDVSFLRCQRVYDSAKGLRKVVSKIILILFKKIELHSLNKSDLVVLNNGKDKKLVEENGFDTRKIFICHPFFHNMLDVQCKNIGKNILFYGAMNRPENYQSAIWFIEKVFPKLESLGFCFIVVGNNPHENLKKYDNGKSIRIMGFVKDVTPFFESSLCLVAPLVMGAGVKIKVIEAMSAGLPVLTNNVGIEGIFAENEKEFFLCSTPGEYERKILILEKNVDLGKKINVNSKMFIRAKYNYEADANLLFQKICDL